jgi:sulfate permease, SulP family
MSPVLSGSGGDGSGSFKRTSFSFEATHSGKSILSAAANAAVAAVDAASNFLVSGTGMTPPSSSFHAPTTLSTTQSTQRERHHHAQQTQHGSQPEQAPVVQGSATASPFISPSSVEEGYPRQDGNHLLSTSLSPPRTATAATITTVLPKSSSSLPPRPHNPRAHAAFVGLINAIIGMPVMLSFTAIIFRHRFFDPYISPLVKVVFLSSALHQAVFAAGSSMPFAVGQVQDVGLIFLSAMASGVVDDCKEAGIDDANTLATALATLTVATTTVGILIVATGALKLASFVQFCPLPVVGGYLAFVGAFMFLSGAGLAAGVPLSVSPKTWIPLFSLDPVLRLLPALVMVAALSAVQRRSRSPYSLPLFLLIVPAMFYIVVFLGGWSLTDVRDKGWMSHPQPEDFQWRFWRLYDLYNFGGDGTISSSSSSDLLSYDFNLSTTRSTSTGVGNVVFGVYSSLSSLWSNFPPKNIYWEAVPRQAGKLVGLYFVVAFGSSMDIAAIQSDAPDVDYNSELVTVGLSNVVTGIAGVGLTGSYIFSQTLFSLKMGIDSRMMGAVVAAAEMLVFMMPVNTMAYVPNFYFGALVLWIGIDIAKDWLYIAAKKVAPIEFAMIVGTFLAVAAFGLELGIAAGILAAALHFAIEYARMSVKAFTVVPSRSGAVRSFKQRMVLEAFDGRVAAVALTGMVFFGSATTMADQVLKVAAVLLECQPHGSPGSDISSTGGGLGCGGSAGSSAAELLSVAATSSRTGAGHGDDSGGAENRRVKPTSSQLTRNMRALRTIPSVATLFRTYDGVAALADGFENENSQSFLPASGSGSGIDIGGGSSMIAAGKALQEAPLVLLLDLSRVHGIDATAARSFLTLHSRLRQRGIRLALTGLRADDAAGKRVRKLLIGQGLILQQPTLPTSSFEFENTHNAPLSPTATATDGSSSSSSTCAWFPTIDEGLNWCEESFLHVAEKYGLCDPPAVSVTLAEVLRANLEVPRAFLGMTHVDHAAAASLLENYFTKQIIVENEVLFDRSDPADALYIVERGSVACFMDYSLSSVRNRAAVAVVPGELAVPHTARILEYGPGGIVGDLDFTLQRPRSFVAKCRKAGALWKLSRAEFERLAHEAPQVLVLLQTVVLRLNCLSATHALEALERTHI